mmetsp:Transcript_51324/g.92462  ORF Transcript_51324/g.92462 Transcript_51324/m.92462 type:complete len:139 (-) Transcript_51324:779-1195(-)
MPGNLCVDSWLKADASPEIRTLRRSAHESTSASGVPKCNEHSSVKCRTQLCKGEARGSPPGAVLARWRWRSSSGASSRSATTAGSAPSVFRSGCGRDDEQEEHEVYGWGGGPGHGTTSGGPGEAVAEAPARHPSTSAA